MTERVHLIHGALNKDASGWDGLIGELRGAGLRPVVRHYGWAGPLTTRRRSRAAGERFAEDVAEGDHVVAFSNGGLVAWEALEVGMKCDRLVLIQPALARDAEFGPGARRITVLYNGGDWIVELSRAWSALNPFGWSEGGWGAMGRRGPDTDDDRVQAIDTAEEADTSGHFAWRGDYARHWYPRIVELLKG